MLLLAVLVCRLLLLALADLLLVACAARLLCCDWFKAVDTWRLVEDKDDDDDDDDDRDADDALGDSRAEPGMSCWLADCSASWLVGRLPATNMLVGCQAAPVASGCVPRALAPLAPLRAGADKHK